MQKDRKKQRRAERIHQRMTAGVPRRAVRSVAKRRATPMSSRNVAKLFMFCPRQRQTSGGVEDGNAKTPHKTKRCQNENGAI